LSKILVFGENRNDTYAIKELVLGLCPALAPADVRVLREPPTLQRGAGPPAIRSWVSQATRVLAAAKVAHGEAACILAHTDCDATDRDGSFEAKRTRDLQRAGFPQAHAIVPTESIEAWWLLFPDATESVVVSWKGALRPPAGEVDLVAQPKDELTRRTRKKQSKRPYKENDSPAIARAIVAGGHLARPAGTSRSFQRFRSTVDGCCRAAAG
jgi:hypothetical protein